MARGETLRSRQIQPSRAVQTSPQRPRQKNRGGAAQGALRAEKQEVGRGD